MKHDQQECYEGEVEVKEGMKVCRDTNREYLRDCKLHGDLKKKQLVQYTPPGRERDSPWYISMESQPQYWIIHLSLDTAVYVQYSHLDNNQHQTTNTIYSLVNDMTAPPVDSMELHDSLSATTTHINLNFNTIVVITSTEITATIATTTAAITTAITLSASFSDSSTIASYLFSVLLLSYTLSHLSRLFIPNTCSRLLPIALEIVTLDHSTHSQANSIPVINNLFGDFTNAGNTQVALQLNMAERNLDRRMLKSKSHQDFLQALDNSSRVRDRNTQHHTA